MRPQPPTLVENVPNGTYKSRAGKPIHVKRRWMPDSNAVEVELRYGQEAWYMMENESQRTRITEQFDSLMRDYNDRQQDYVR